MAEQPETTETRLIFATGTVPSPLGPIYINLPVAVETTEKSEEAPNNEQK